MRPTSGVLFALLLSASFASSQTQSPNPSQTFILNDGGTSRRMESIDHRNPESNGAH